MDSFLKRGHLKTTELRIAAGAVCEYERRRVKVIEIITMNRALVTDLQSDQLLRAPLTQLKLPADTADTPSIVPAPRDYAAYGDEEWQEINRRFETISPLLSMLSRTRDDVEQVAENSGFSVALIYQMIKSYEATNSKSSLLPRKRGRKTGTSLLDPRVEAVIAEGIRKHYLNEQKKNGSAVYRFVKTRCRTLGLDVPCENAVRLRLERIDPAESKKARRSRDEAKQAIKQVGTGIPGAERPLDFIQIDHTRVDLIIVDEQDREALTRPWVTVAIDVKTRCIVGIYFSLDPPSYVSVGSVIANMLLPKDQYLAELELSVDWPMWGPPQKIGADNGADFRSNYLKDLPSEYPFTVEWRPLDGTNYGGHIERLLGTFALWMKELPGTTFSSVSEKGDYDAEGNSALTLHELERYVVRHICEVYHKERHRGLKESATPYREWERGILGTPTQAGIGIPIIYSDPDRVKVDFLPHFRRTVTRSGITFETIPYQCPDIFGPVRLANEGKDRFEKQQLFRWDPRNITRIWMWDPIADGYHLIAIDVANMPAMSFSEYKAHKNALRKKHLPHDAVHIARHAEHNYALVDEAKKKTKAQRRANERRVQNARKAVIASTTAPNTNIPRASSAFPDDIDERDVAAYDDSNEW